MGMSLVASPAWALDWHHNVFSYASTDQQARGVSIRQWGPQGRVFLFTHLNGDTIPTGLEQSAEAEEWACLPAGGGFDYCENILLQNHEVVGPTSTGVHLLHPAAAVRHQGGGDLELTLSRVVKDYAVTCPTDANGNEQWDLVSYLFEPDHSGANDITDEHPIQAAFATAECADHGITELAYDGAVPHACYTRFLGGEEFIECNEDDGTGVGEWANAQALDHEEDLVAGWSSEEDHPSFVTSPNGRIVAGHRHNYDPAGPEPQNIEVTFPSSDNVYLDTWTLQRKNFPNASRNYDDYLGKYVLRVVWEFDQGANAQLRYGSCHTGCDDLANWTLEIITSSHRDAERVHHAVDKVRNREFVVFAYDSQTPGFGVTNRVVMGTRCLGDAASMWAFEEVRPTPPHLSDDQKLNYGRPALSLDRTNQMVMVAFVEASSWDNGNAWAAGSDGDVVFARADYSGLSCN